VLVEAAVGTSALNLMETVHRVVLVLFNFGI
jgi:hypothetical protein